MEIVQSKLEAVIVEKAKGSNLGEITWKGKTIPLRNEKARVSILSAQQETQETITSPEKFDKVFGFLAEAQALLKEDLSVKNNVPQPIVNTLLKMTTKSKTPNKEKKKTVDEVETKSILEYVNSLKLSCTLEKNLLILHDLERQYGEKSLHFHSFFNKFIETYEAGSTSQKKPPKPEDIARLYETLIQVFKIIHQK
jgi:hypothetical protein